jgi:outer membrane lipoprotein SlyB
MKRRLIALGMVFALVLTGCSSDDGDTTDGSTASTTATTMAP